MIVAFFWPAPCWPRRGAANAAVTVTPTVVSSTMTIRGISQTASDPAVQPGANHAHESGFYGKASAGSNADGLGRAPNVEAIAFAGYTFVGLEGVRGL